ncbi:tellurite resistance TerB family protein [Albimonas pacifica]|uniref:Uncharacterized membrane protein YebE, DUF533 family n=1 Tax=Albimonas pacifica TaxID=1114924 RepID=A0A1I3GR85_9RHOB|nr:tellurite resistance TerB family protein [Albimonas pacifica]SFI25906.1 Uncharacterized membrane protein YebE, DUF533 family [Albimonas pacifica]
MSFGNIIGGLLQKGLASQSHDRLRSGVGRAEAGGGADRILQSLLGGSAARGGSGGAGATGGGGLMDLARQFLTTEQVGGMSGAKIGGLGALAGGLLGGGLSGAAKGGAMAVLGTVALKAWREHQAGAAPGDTSISAEPAPEELEALTDPRTEKLVLQAMIAAAQVDGHVDERELDAILAQMTDGEATPDEREAVREAVRRPVDLQEIARGVSRPEAAIEVYLGALLAVDIDTEAERAWFRDLASALKLDRDVVARLHRMTDAPMV